MGSEWRDIETAPKDGTPFLAALTSGHSTILWATEGVRKNWKYSWWGGHVADVPYEPSHPLNTDWSNTQRATHWQPLPSPPTEG